MTEMRIGLLLCSLLVTLSLWGQEMATPQDSLTATHRDNRPIMPNDSLTAMPLDSLTRQIIENDLAQALPKDTLSNISSNDTTANVADTDTAGYKPVSQKSLWYAALMPGLGQIYNHRYWKLPIVIGGAVGVTYAITWNNKYYEAYTYAYRDLNDNDPNTNYHIKLLGEDAASKSSLITNRQQTFRRQRDLSIIIGVLLYGLCILDSYVDAELFNFDISDDISLELGHPVSVPSTSFPSYDQQITQATPVSLSWSLTF